MRPSSPKTRELVSPRVKLFTDSVIREMTRLAAVHGAINMAQGYPDFAAPSVLKAAAARAVREDYNQYEITWGSTELRAAIAEKARRFNGIQATGEDNVTVTCGATEAMVATMLALTDSDDEVIVPEPFYECYLPSAIISGARVRHVQLKGPRFEFDEEELKRAFSGGGGRKPKAIMINTPNNPTGRVFSRSELELLADLCADNGVLAITDEIYEQIVYDGAKHVSLATLGDMADTTVTISGASKTYSVTGWRIGYTVAEKRLTEAIRKVHDFLTVCAPAPLQRAALTAYSLPESYYSSLTRSYTRKRDYLMKSLEAMGFDCLKPQGAYFIMADFSELWKGDDVSFAERMVKDGGVAMVPASSFFSSPGLGRKQARLAFPKQDRTLREAVERMRKRVG
ncbi:MAG TPA: aminotransferase class I/II-fold pyridoxal phosphate-dependent enzyme [Nitrososphaerales archaeon]|nr:aminotransferase class I/II-fold pyridoxal phosphate-dependent enzyme [Nitrososphaerales archaeon]